MLTKAVNGSVLCQRFGRSLLRPAGRIGLSLERKAFCFEFNGKYAVLLGESALWFCWGGCLHC